MVSPVRSRPESEAGLSSISVSDILDNVRGRSSVVFQNGHSMAVRLLGECRLPKGTRVRQYRDGGRIVIEPICAWPQDFVEALGSVTDEIPRPAQERKQRDPFV
jgi:virulence-associated protein VagC